MKNLIRSFFISVALITLVVAKPSTAGLDTPEAAMIPQPQMSLDGGPPAVVRLDPTTSKLRVAAPSRLALTRPQSAEILIRYLPGGTQNVYGSQCFDWPDNAKIAFDYAASIWASLIHSSEPIEINACWTDLPSNVLGYGATASYHYFTDDSAYYPAALANALKKRDLNDSDERDSDGDLLDDDADIIVAYGRDFNWYFGTDGQTPTNQTDFASVVLHEICHGLGFAGAMKWDDGSLQNGQECNGTAGVGCWRVYSDDPAAYDRFTENGSGQASLNLANYSRELGAHLTSENVFFDGASATAANGGTPAKLFAPGTWMQGSSYSHLDESYNGTQNTMMTYSIPRGESTHSPGSVAMGILWDLGWGVTQQTPDLSLAMYTVGNLAPSPGDVVSYALSVSNIGQGIATGVVVTNLLSSDILTPSWRISLSLNGTALRSGSTYAWDLPDLAANAAGVITVTGTLNPALPADEAILERATISANESEENTLNNSGAVIIGGPVIYLPKVLRQ